MATRKKTELTKPDQLPTDLAELGLTDEDMGAGFEDTNAESYAIPFLRILQSNSPACDEMNEQTRIEGARPGMFINTVTEEIFDGKEKGVRFVPCHYHQRYLQWAPRDDGGGLKAVLDPVQYQAMENEGRVARIENRLYVKDSAGQVNERCDTISDTRSHFGLVLPDEEGRMPIQCILSLAGTQVKKSRQIMALLGNRRVQISGRMVQLPSFSAILRLTTVGESNDSGSWAGLKAVLEGNNTDPINLSMAREFYKACQADKSRVNYANSQETPVGEDNIPF